MAYNIMGLNVASRYSNLYLSQYWKQNLLSDSVKLIYLSVQSGITFSNMFVKSLQP